MKEGMYNLPFASYLADPCDQPALSRSVADALLTRSPLHGFMLHPRLNPDIEREERADFDLGTACHDLLLEGKERFEVLPFDNCKTKDAKEKRDVARDRGLIPLLPKQWDRVIAMTDSVPKQMVAHNLFTPFADGYVEHSLFWQEDNGVWCKTRPDFISSDKTVILDYKTTAQSAHPNAWTKGPFFGSACDIQAAMGIRGIKRLFGIDAEIKFIVQEAYPPYALSIVGLTTEMLRFAESRFLRAVDIWGECLENNSWPGYPAVTCYVEPPAWKQTEWMESEMQREFLNGNETEYIQSAISAYAPGGKS